jgi:hypothetical protein
MLRRFMSGFVVMMAVLASLFAIYSKYVFVSGGWRALITLVAQRSFYAVVLVSPVIAAVGSAVRLLEDKIGTSREKD